MFEPFKCFLGILLGALLIQNAAGFGIGPLWFKTNTYVGISWTQAAINARLNVTNQTTTLIKKIIVQPLDHFGPNQHKSESSSDGKVVKPIGKVNVKDNDNRNKNTYAGIRKPRSVPGAGLTFKQRLFVIENYWDRQRGAVIILLGDQKTFIEGDIRYSFVQELAQRFRCLLIGVEHRYYGESIPDNGLKPEQLKFLTVNQALADVAYLKDDMIKNRLLKSTTKFVVYGGGYAGTLAAELRIKYPTYFQCAVASSAPFKFEADYHRYNDMVFASLSNPAVGGSTQCAQAVLKAFREIDAILDAGNKTQLTSDFMSCGALVTYQDEFIFTVNLATSVQYLVQYNNRIGLGGNIQALCSLMITAGPSAAYNNFVTLFQQVPPILGLTCIDNSWVNFITANAATNLDRVNLPSGRQQIFQSCTELGVFESCSFPSDCPFSTRQQFVYFAEICRLLFGITPKVLRDTVDLARAAYDPCTDLHKIPDILFTSGQIDPNYVLGVPNSISLQEPSIFVRTLSSSAEFDPTLPTDRLELTGLRQKIIRFIGQCLVKP